MAGSCHKTGGDEMVLPGSSSVSSAMRTMQRSEGESSRVDRRGIRPPDAYAVRRGPAPDGVIVVEIEGELDLGAAPALETHVRTAGAEGPRAVVFDMTEVGFVDSSALRVLLRARQRLADDGIEFVLAGVAPPVRRLFELTSTDKLLPMAPTVADAVARLENGDASG
jgi:anti-anti-sigma factor